MKTWIMQQQWVKEGNKNTVGGKKKKKRKRTEGGKNRREWHKIKYIAGKAKKNFYHSR